MPINPTDRWYRGEFTPPNLAALTAKLRAHFDVSPMHIGSKGDLNHQRGYHRSRAFIENSPYCTNRRYSVTAAVDRGGDDNWLSAVDMTLPRAELIAVCRRLDAAARAGLIEKVVEWYGNDDGDNKVDGWNNIANVVASSDSSHLWHAHLSIARSRANDNHDDLFDIITGGDDMAEFTPEHARKLDEVHSLLRFGRRPSGAQTADGGVPIAFLPKAFHTLGVELGDITSEVDELQELAAANGDPDVLAAAISERLAPAQQQALMAALQRIHISVDE